MKSTKSFEISKHVVSEAYKRVKANKGAAGVDGESLAQFELHLKPNLYKIWKTKKVPEGKNKKGAGGNMF